MLGHARRAGMCGGGLIAAEASSAPATGAGQLYAWTGAGHRATAGRRTDGPQQATGRRTDGPQQATGRRTDGPQQATGRRTDGASGRAGA
ncbi:hypothetical protein [Streptomyces sp. NPDC058411]|uniref:hypothetical protein n=1 Tax=Streptomyces sp. NPDC058411 TaxID=3346485 RepID=UPI003666D823